MMSMPHSIYFMNDKQGTCSLSPKLPKSNMTISFLYLAVSRIQRRPGERDRGADASQHRRDRQPRHHAEGGNAQAIIRHNLRYQAGTSPELTTIIILYVLYVSVNCE